MVLILKIVASREGLDGFQAFWAAEFQRDIIKKI